MTSSAGVGGVRGGDAWANDGRHDAVEPVGPTREVYRSDSVRVVADHPVDAAQAARLAQRIESAYRSDAARLKWDDARPLAEQLTVAVLSARAFAAVTGDSTGAIAGVTTGPNLFVMPDRVLSRFGPDDADTIAHELTHVQDLRQAGSSVDSIPTYLLEGKAYVVGDAYARGNLAHLESVAATLGQLSADDAAWVLRNFRRPEAEQNAPRAVYLGEITGALFVEFLRTRLNGRGDAAALDKLSNATDVVDEGVSFAAAFAREFGVPLSEAERQFVRYIGQTEADPEARLQGTLYDPGR